MKGIIVSDATAILTGEKGGNNYVKTQKGSFKVSEGSRDRQIVKAVEKYGYSQKEVADYLEMHYSTISRTMKNVTTAKSKTPLDWICGIAAL